MSDECLMKQETVFLFYTLYQAVMRKFTLAGKSFTASTGWDYSNIFVFHNKIVKLIGYVYYYSLNLYLCIYLILKSTS